MVILFAACGREVCSDSWPPSRLFMRLDNPRIVSHQRGDGKRDLGGEKVKS